METSCCLSCSSCCKQGSCEVRPEAPNWGLFLLLFCISVCKWPVFIGATARSQGGKLGGWTADAASPSVPRQRRLRACVCNDTPGDTQAHRRPHGSADGWTFFLSSIPPGRLRTWPGSRCLVGDVAELLPQHRSAREEGRLPRPLRGPLPREGCLQARREGTGRSAVLGSA